MNQTICESGYFPLFVHREQGGDELPCMRRTLGIHKASEIVHEISTQSSFAFATQQKNQSMFLAIRNRILAILNIYQNLQEEEQENRTLRGIAQ